MCPVFQYFLSLALVRTEIHKLFSSIVLAFAFVSNFTFYVVSLFSVISVKIKRAGKTRR